MLAHCGLEDKDNEKAERMSIVALLCIQNSPDARPLMSDVVKMLDGVKEVRQPANPIILKQLNLILHCNFKVM